MSESVKQSDILRISFQPGLVESVLTSLVTAADQLLENPAMHYPQPVYFFEKIYPHDPWISPILKAIHMKMEEPLEGAWFTEQIHVVLERLLFVHRQVLKEIRKLPAIKRSTQLELYRRLENGRELIEDLYQQELSLDEIAKAAHLSKHHFLRLFKHVFRKTPYQYVIEKRLQYFSQQLLSSHKSITELVFESGFSDLSGFNRQFRKFFGVSPQQYRNQIHSL